MKFEIGISKECFSNIQRLAIETTQKDNKTNQEVYRVLKSDIAVGSFDRHINVYCPSEHIANIEFSLPKYLFGHNVTMIKAGQVIEVVRKVHKDFSDKFGAIEPYNNWFIKRLDLCYVWKLKNQEEEEKVLLALKSLEYLNKTKKHLYDTSVMWTGQNYSFKYYLKYPEYLKHDFKVLIKEGQIALAYKLLEESKYVLRFEITLRSERIKYLLGARFPKFSDLFNGFKPIEDLVWEILDYYQKRIFRVDTKIQNKINVFDLLRNEYGKEKARRLEEYWTMDQSDNVGKARSIDNYSSSQRWRNLRDIKNAGVGVSSNNINVDLTIDKTKLI